MDYTNIINFNGHVEENEFKQGDILLIENIDKKIIEVNNYIIIIYENNLFLVKVYKVNNILKVKINNNFICLSEVTLISKVLKLICRYL